VPYTNFFSEQNSSTMKVSRSRIFTLRGLTLFVFFLLAVLASAQEDIPVPADPEAIAEEGEEGAGDSEDAEEEVADDQHEECPDWAFEGECGENAEFMWLECGSSCDNHEKCEGWADDGECFDNTDLMMEECAGYCDDGEEEEGEEEEGEEEEEEL
jgi:hypothetical protein